MWGTGVEFPTACRLHGYEGGNAEAFEFPEVSIAGMSQDYGEPVRVGNSAGQLQEMAETLSLAANRWGREWEGLRSYLRETAASLRRHASRVS